MLGGGIVGATVGDNENLIDVLSATDGFENINNAFCFIVGRNNSRDARAFGDGIEHRGTRKGRYQEPMTSVTLSASCASAM